MVYHNVILSTHRYQGLIFLAVVQSALATIITIICKTHVEPLNSKAVVAFAVKNFRYFGLPMQLILLAFINTILALIIWIFGSYGLFAGLFASGASAFGTLSVHFVWSFVWSWKNEGLSEKVREKRADVHKKIRKTIFPFNVLDWISRRLMKIRIWIWFRIFFW